MIAGGSGSRMNLVSMLYRGLFEKSDWSRSAAEYSRPFDLHRSGIVCGEGAGMVVLERESVARRRGAKILARIAGFGTICNTKGASGWTNAIERSVRQAMRNHANAENEFHHINAHGASSLVEDPREAQAIASISRDTPVIACKSQFGNLGAGGGCVELIASVMAMQQGVLPGNRNFEFPDPNCPVRITRENYPTSNGTFALKLSQAQTGQCVALLLEKLKA
jgi:3-oxoacyl-[acyl-carrier-protein] synthase II